MKTVPLLWNHSPDQKPIATGEDAVAIHAAMMRSLERVPVIYGRHFDNLDDVPAPHVVFDLGHDAAIERLWIDGELVFSSASPQTR